MSPKKSPKVELTLPIIPDMELAAIKTADVIAKHMNLGEEKSAEIGMALIEATINAFEHSGTDSGSVEIHFVIQDDTRVIKVTDTGKGFNQADVKMAKIEEKLGSDPKLGWGLQLIQ